MQYYEIATFAVTSGVICLAVFRALGRRTFGTIWFFPEDLPSVDVRHILVGASQLHW